MSAPPKSTPALGLPSLLALGINGIVGVGIFFAPAEVAALVPGTTGVMVYVVTAAALLPIAATYATLGGRFDEDGGPYVWARAAFGPNAAFFVGWIAYVSALFSTSTVVSGLARFAGPSVGLSGPTGSRVFVVLCVCTLSAIVATGLRPSAIVWNVVTLVKLTPLLLLAGVSIAVASSLPAATEPSTPATVEGFGRAALVVVFATQGFEIVPVPAGKARRPSLAVPLATVGSLLAAVGLYVVLHLGCVRALPDLSKSAAPLADAAGVYGGSSFSALVALGTNISALGICFGMFAMTPRYLLALGRDDGLGAWVGRETKTGVPRRALWVTAAIVMVFVLSGRLDELFVLSSVTVLTQYAVAAAALGVLSWKRHRGLRRIHWWPAPLALGAIVLIGRAAKWSELVVAAGVLAVGGVLLYARRRSVPSGS